MIGEPGRTSIVAVPSRVRLTFTTSLLSLALASSLGCFGPKWGAASTNPDVLTIGPATFAEDSGVTPAVVEKCDLQHELPEEISRRAPVATALANDPSAGAAVLTLEVTKIVATGGGRYSGPKQLDVHGEMISGGHVIGSFDVRRTTMRSVSTCNMLDHVVDAIAKKDVKKWLKSPTVGAKLGEFK